MSILDIIKKRRSIRKYKEKEVDLSKIHQIIEAGIWAPSSGNTMPFKFFILKDKKQINEFFSLTLDSVIKWKKETIDNMELTVEEMKERYKQYLDNLQTAPVLVFVFFDLEKGAKVFTEGDLGKFKANTYLYNSLRDSLFLCVENMLLEAAALDLGSLYFELPRAAGTPVNQFFNLEETFEFFICIPIGYADENPEPTERRVEDFLLEIK